MTHCLSPEQRDEVSRWLTLRRIGESEIIKFVMFDNRDFWRGDFDRAGELVIRVVRRFCRGDCYRLATAAALARDVRVAAFYRRDEPDTLAHAFAFDPATHVAADILGSRPIRDAVAEVREAIKVTISVEAPDESVLWEDGEEVRLIAGAFPWLSGRADRHVTPFADLVDLFERGHGQHSGRRQSE